MRSTLATLLGLAALVYSLASPALSASSPIYSLKERRNELVVRQEYDISCGAAALATLLKYQHGKDVTERQVALGLIKREEYLENPALVRLRQGFSLLDMKRYADSLGFEGIGYGGLRLSDLERLSPIIVPIDSSGYSHFVVFRGTLANRVLLADPAFGARTMRVEHFRSMWIDFPKMGRVGFVVKRPDGLIPPNRLMPKPRDFLTFQ